MERDGFGGFELAVVVVAGAAVAVILAVWAGALLSLVLAGRPQGVPFSAAADALPRLPGSFDRPASAWVAPHQDVLPGPLLYWLSTGISAASFSAAIGGAWHWIGRSKIGTSKRRPLGVDARPRFASRRDLQSLLVDAPTRGRLIIARFGRSLVATEAPPEQGFTPARRLGMKPPRRGDRGALALVGPSRSGKTTAVVAGILEWDGPALLSSVKADLLATTHGWRSTLGEARVYDPTSTSIPEGTSAFWSPLQQSGTIVGAQRAARALCDAAPRGGVEGGMDFWLAQAEILLSSLLFVAHHSHLDMGTVCQWVLTQDRPGALGIGEVRQATNVLLRSNSRAVSDGAAEISKGLTSVWEMEDRTRSSIYATAQTVVWPWADPGVAKSAAMPKKKEHDRPGSQPKESDGLDSIDLAWLLSGTNTIYLCSPIEDQRRLAPAFGGLLNDVINQAYRHVASTGQALDPPLLVVIDEAGNTPLRSLPEYASTLAGIGVLLVTIWQSIAQIEVGS